MNTFIRIIVIILWCLFGKDTYKSLKSYPDLETMLPNVAATLKRLIEVKTNDESVVEGRNEYITSYKWFKGNLFNVLIYKYVILNENFKDNAVNNKNFRIIEFNFDESWIGKFIIDKFAIKSLFVNKKPDEIEASFKNIDNATVLTAIQWNAFWESIINSSPKDKTLENLSCECLLLSQIPGVKGKCNIYVGDDDKLKQVAELEGNKDLKPEELKEKIDDLLFQSFSTFCDFRNETEFPAEFMLIKCPDDNKLCDISPSMIELTDDNVNKIYDIHSYLFNDI